MANDAVKEQVARTFAEINTEMKKLGASPTSAQITAVMEKAITAAFMAIGKENDNDLYKTLSFKFHPDRLKDNKEDFAQLLKTDEQLKNIPFQTLRSIYTNIDAIRQKQNDPKVQAQARAHTRARENIAKPTSTYEKAGIAIGISLAILFNKHNRYIEPFRTLVYLAQWGLAFGLIGALAVAFLAMSIPQRIYQFIEKTALNILTRFEYQAELERRATPEKLVALAKSKLTAAGVDLSSEADKDILKLYRNIAINNGLSDKYAMQALKNEIIKKISGIEHVSVVIYAIGIAGGKDLPGGFFSKIASIPARIILAIFAIPLVALDICLRILDEVISAVGNGLLGAGVVVLAVSVFAMNLPLYAMDGLSYLARGGRPENKQTPPPAAEQTADAPNTAPQFDAFFEKRAGATRSPMDGPMPDKHSTDEPSARAKQSAEPKENNLPPRGSFFDAPPRTPAATPADHKPPRHDGGPKV